MNKNYLLFMMGGTGTRTQKNLPKQYILVNGVPIFAYTLKTYDTLDFIDGIIIVANEYYKDYIYKWIDKLNIKKVIKIVEGGSIRSESVLNGILGFQNIAKSNDILIVHDASSPYVDVNATKKAIQASNKGYFTTLGVRQHVTVYNIDDNDNIKNVIPRDYVVPGACPDTFQYGRVKKIYTNATYEDLSKMTSALALGVERKIPSKIIETTMLPIKITYSEDIKIFRTLVDIYYFPNFKDKYMDLLEIEKELVQS